MVFYRHLGLGMAIDSVRLREVLERVSVPSAAAAVDAMRGVAVHTAPPELLDATLRLLRLLDTPKDIPAIAPLIEQEILYRLLTGPCGPTLLRIAAIDSPSNKIAKAIAWLRQNYTHQILRRCSSELRAKLTEVCAKWTWHIDRAPEWKRRRRHSEVLPRSGRRAIVSGIRRHSQPIPYFPHRVARAAQRSGKSRVHRAELWVTVQSYIDKSS
jgi:AraC-type transcriptional regulator N-terminus